jgi:hypothetical protein
MFTSIRTTISTATPILTAAIVAVPVA